MAEGHKEGRWKCEEERFYLEHSDGREEAGYEANNGSAAFP